MFATESTLPLSYVLIPVLAAGGLSIVGALAGAWFGKRWERANQDRAWEKDRRLEAYSRLAGAYADLVYEAHRARSITHTQDSDLARTTERLAQVNAAASAVQILGPDQLTGMVRDIGPHMLLLSSKVDTATPRSEYIDKVNEITRMVEDFEDAANKALRDSPPTNP